MKPIVAAETCLALGATQEQLQPYANRHAKIGALEVSRALPIKDRRLVGPWCFLDRFGPLTFTDGVPMDVAPRPHIGLQTVTWLLEGEVLHDDSLQHESVLRPGGLNVMTSGGGIAHAERTPADNTGRLNGVQLWTALPDEHRHVTASFQHVAHVPSLEFPGGVIRVFSGGLETVNSPAQHYSELLGADLQVHPRATLNIPLRPSYEYAVLILSGDCLFEGQRIDDGVLYYLGTQRSETTMSSTGGGRVLLIGGPPFPETILMWWNFVARTPEEIRAARTDREDRRRFGEVIAYKGPRLTAPDLVRFARPNPLS